MLHDSQIFYIHVLFFTIQSSKNVILVISPASLQSEWSKFEMLMAVDDSHKRNTVCLVPVLVGGVNVVDLPAPLRPLTCIELKEDLQNIEEIIRAISSKICLNCVIASLWLFLF